MNIRITLYDLHRKLIAVDHATRSGAEIEIDACNERIRRKEASSIVIEPLSSAGAEYVEELRKRARGY